MSTDLYSMYSLNFTEALKDSPSFRWKLNLNERYFEKLQKRVEETLRNVEFVTNHADNFISSFYNLIASLNGLWIDMNVNDKKLIQSYKLMSEALNQIVLLNKNLIENVFLDFRLKLDTFLKRDLLKLNETRSHFESLSTSLNESLFKKAAINKNKIQELQDAKNSLTAVGTCFAHNSLDYVAQLNIIHACKAQVILESLWILVTQYSEFFHKGHLFFNDKTEISCEEISETLTNLKDQVKIIERKMQDCHAAVPKEVFQHPTGMSLDPQVVMEGYLFKRSTNAFKTWNRRWFMIRENKFLYSHKLIETEVPTVMEENLKLCLVRQAPPSIERTCCFELVTPLKNHLLQADSEALCNTWIRALQRTIQHLHEDDHDYDLPRSSFLDNLNQKISNQEDNVTENILRKNSISNLQLASIKTMPSNISLINNNTNTNLDINFPLNNDNNNLNLLLNNEENNFFITDKNDKKNKKIEPHSTKSIVSSNRTDMLLFLHNLKRIKGNDRCADCDDLFPKWTCLNYGVIICIECSGAHRSLGVHYSKVRSLTMDILDTEQRNILLQLGNEKVNSILLSEFSKENISDDLKMYQKPTKYSSRDCRELWINLKYVNKKFVNKFKNITENDNNNEICNKNDEDLIEDALTTGNIENVLRFYAEGKLDLNKQIKSTYPLHIAVKNHKLTLIEFLMLNDVKINTTDDMLNSALHIAADLGHTIEVYQLLKRGANKSLKNKFEQTPLMLAVKKQHADIVTLLRLHEMREECNDDMNSTMNDIDNFISDLVARQKLNNLDSS